MLPKEGVDATISGRVAACQSSGCCKAAPATVVVGALLAEVSVLLRCYQGDDVLQHGPWRGRWGCQRMPWQGWRGCWRRRAAGEGSRSPRSPENRSQIPSTPQGVFFIFYLFGSRSVDSGRTVLIDCIV
jgi:hypothetical protein